RPAAQATRRGDAPGTRRAHRLPSTTPINWDLTAVGSFYGRASRRLRRTSVAIRSWQPRRIARIEPVLSATGALSYLALLLAVIGPNAEAIIDAPATMLLLAAAGLALNVSGYGLAFAARPLLAERGDRVAMLFTVSKKEFSIAAMVVFSSGLPADVALPAVIYAIVQMITSPAVASRVARSAALDE
ncbi:hypothetical protein FTX61_21390, partial [Nitriliruptoraceae bacterium ZYF776]|nr:hypothetical protein [Profundirhabdus halotolerans]